MRDPSGNEAAATTARHPYGPRPLGALVAAITKPAFRKRSPAAAQILSDWAAIVGPALADVATPRRLAAGTLTLACAGPVALELQHLSGELVARINGHLGRVAVERLRFVQDVAPGRPVPGPQAVPRRPNGPAPAVSVPGLPPGSLHDALAALGRAMREAGAA